MKTIIDSKLYLWFTVVCLGICIILAGVSLYSVIFVENKVQQLLMVEETEQAMSYNEAYIRLRNPQIFAGYDFFDVEDSVIKKILSYFDSKLSSDENIEGADIEYLYMLLDRRISGSRLGIKTSAFFLILSIGGLLAFLYERRTLHKIISKICAYFVRLYSYMKNMRKKGTN